MSQIAAWVVRKRWADAGDLTAAVAALAVGSAGGSSSLDYSLEADRVNAGAAAQAGSRPLGMMRARR